MTVLGSGNSRRVCQTIPHYYMTEMMRSCSETSTSLARPLMRFLHYTRVSLLHTSLRVFICFRRKTRALKSENISAKFVAASDHRDTRRCQSIAYVKYVSAKPHFRRKVTRLKNNHISATAAFTGYLTTKILRKTKKNR